MNKSKIKCLGNSIDTNELFLHPITLELKFNKGQHESLRIVSKLKHKKYSLFFIASNIKINFFLEY